MDGSAAINMDVKRLQLLIRAPMSFNSPWWNAGLFLKRMEPYDMLAHCAA